MKKIVLKYSKKKKKVNLDGLLGNICLTPKNLVIKGVKGEQKRYKAHRKGLNSLGKNYLIGNYIKCKEIKTLIKRQGLMEEMK